MLDIEQALRISNGKILGVFIRLFGVACEVYAPNESTTLYGEEDQAFDYGPTPDYSGKLLITGLNELRFAAEDDWSPGEIKLFTPVDASLGFIPQENAKIVVSDNDNQFTLRVLNRRTITGQHLELIHQFELVGFN